MVKQMKFMIAFFAMILFAVSLASAAVTSSTISYPTLVNNSQGYFNISFTLNNTDTVEQNVSFSGSVIGLSSGFADLSNVTVANESTLFVVKRVNFDSASTGSIAGSISINGVAQLFSVNVQQTPASTTSGNVNVTRMCTYGINGTNLLSLSDIEDKSGLDDDWNWKALDDITVRVTFNNNGDKDNEDYKVQLYFFDETGKDVSNKFVDDTDSLKQEINNLDSGDDIDMDFEFKLSTDVDSGDYRMFVKAYRTSQEKAQCIVLEGDTKIAVDQEDDYVLVSSVTTSTTPVSCGDNIEITATISNTGSNDQDRVKVILYNKDLGLNLFREIDNMDSGDETDVSFSFTISPNAVEKLYRLYLSTEFEYDDDDNSYDSQSDSEDDYVYSLNVVGNCNDPTKPTITAKLNSTALVGKDLVIEVDVKNNANQSMSAIVMPEEFESWAELVGVEPTTLSISKQATGKAYITLTPTQSGQQTFNINVIYNGKSIDQPITVKISEKTGLFSGLFNQFGKVGAYLILGIAILVVLIIIVFVIRLILSRKD